MSVEIKAVCNLHGKELTYDDYFSYRCDSYIPFDTNLQTLLNFVPEVFDNIKDAARCWNCRYSLLIIRYAVTIYEARPEEEERAAETAEASETEAERET